MIPPSLLLALIVLAAAWGIARERDDGRWRTPLLLVAGVFGALLVPLSWFPGVMVLCGAAALAWYRRPPIV